MILKQNLARLYRGTLRSPTGEDLLYDDHYLCLRNFCKQKYLSISFSKLGYLGVKD